MKTIKIFDEKNYDTSWQRVEREAVRAVILRGNKIAMVRSRKEGFYKFPGGGIEADETHLKAVIRETEEETGLQVIPGSVKELGIVWEIRKGLFGEEIFDQKSYYYLAEVLDEVKEQKLDKYEQELGYELVWEDLKKAYEINMELGQKYETTFIIRESYILEYLLQ